MTRLTYWSWSWQPPRRPWSGTPSVRPGVAVYQGPPYCLCLHLRPHERCSGKWENQVGEHQTFRHGTAGFQRELWKLMTCTLTWSCCLLYCQQYPGECSLGETAGGNRVLIAPNPPSGTSPSKVTLTKNSRRFVPGQLTLSVPVFLGLMAVSKNLPFFHLEDMFKGMAAKSLEVRPVSIKGFFNMVQHSLFVPIETRSWPLIIDPLTLRKYWDLSRDCALQNRTSRDLYVPRYVWNNE